VKEYIRGCDAHAWFKSLHKWTVTHREEFWSSLWSFLNIPCSSSFTKAYEAGATFQSTKFYVGAKVNLAQTLLRCPEDDRIAVGT